MEGADGENDVTGVNLACSVLHDALRGLYIPSQSHAARRAELPTRRASVYGLAIRQWCLSTCSERLRHSLGAFELSHLLLGEKLHPPDVACVWP